MRVENRVRLSAELGSVFIRFIKYLGYLGLL